VRLESSKLLDRQRNSVGGEFQTVGPFQPRDNAVIPAYSAGEKNTTTNTFWPFGGKNKTYSRQKTHTYSNNSREKTTKKNRKPS